MCDYKIPIIPNLNIPKNDAGKYSFQIIEGKLIIQDSEEFCEVYDIKIEISDFINFSFNINAENFKEYFLEGINDDEYKISWNRIYSLQGIFENYDVYLEDCYFKEFHSESRLHLQAEKISLNENCEYTYDDTYVNVWHILESDVILQSDYQEFDSQNLQGLLLKSINTIDYNRLSENAYELQEKQQKSFNQLLGETSFLFQKTSYSNVDNEIINNIENLLKFYDSNIIPIRMKIIEDIETHKLEIIIQSKNITNLNGESIFWEVPNNFFNFINSSYDKYLEVKNGDVNIDLLLHYYALMKNQQYYEVKLILSSTFMEIYKNDFKDESRNEDLSLYHRLNNRMGELKLDTIKLLEFLQPEIHKIIYDTKRKFLSLRPDENRKIHTIWKKYIESYLISIIAFYRNKFVHSGRFIMNRNDVEYFIIEKWISIQKKGLADSYGDLANLMEGSIKQKILNCQNIFNVNYQSKIFEYLIEIILLRLLDVNCCLNAEKQFSLKSEGDNDVSIHEILENFNELKDGNELIEEELYEIIEENSGRCNLNSKDYVDNFLR